MPEEKPLDGSETIPSGDTVPTSSPNSANPEEEALDAKVRENLGEHLAPVEEEVTDPAPAVPEKKPEAGEDPAKGGDEPEPSPDKPPEVVPPTPPHEEKPGRLDTRLATLYLQNLALTGTKEIPTLEAVLEDLKNHSKADKINALHLHRLENKKLRGVKVNSHEASDADDEEITSEAQKDILREEIRQEEYEKNVKEHFVSFVNAHPELDEEKPEYNETLAIAVQTLWEGGMLISDAFDTVTGQIQKVQEEAAKTKEREKQAALSGAVTATHDSTPENGELTWEDMQTLMEKDPAKWAQLINQGYQPKG